MTSDTYRKSSSGFFGFALFCFLLPFVTLSCPGMDATLTGAQLATGTTLEGQQIGGDVVAVAALLFTACALGLSLIPGREALVGAMLTGVSGALSLLLLGLRLPQLAHQQTEGLVRVSFEVGYWLSLAAVATAATLCYRVASVGEGPAGEGSVLPPEQADARAQDPPRENTPGAAG